MKTFVIALTALIITSELASAQPPRDVTGWGKIKWGMTFTAARALYEVEGEESSTYADFLTIHPVDIGDTKLATSLSGKHGSGLVTNVQLFCTYGLPNSEGCHPNSFDNLKTLLTQKYGPPTSDEQRFEYGDRVGRTVWVFPSTSIELKVSKKSDVLGIVTLRYQGADKKAVDSL